LQNINFKKVFARKVTGNRQNRRFPVTILRYSFVTLAPKAHFATRPFYHTIAAARQTGVFLPKKQKVTRGLHQSRIEEKTD
ncbi:MAG: hypothetical protein IKI69_02565, partial [Oscillospiraceae bacterium]|nr:hypothetical protein [Oscillospiraceae bacterium]